MKILTKAKTGKTGNTSMRVIEFIHSKLFRLPIFLSIGTKRLPHSLPAPTKKTAIILILGSDENKI
jgi:hypothetical protein